MFFVLLNRYVLFSDVSHIFHLTISARTFFQNDSLIIPARVPHAQKSETRVAHSPREIGFAGRNRTRASRELWGRVPLGRTEPLLCI